MRISSQHLLSLRTPLCNVELDKHNFSAPEAKIFQYSTPSSKSHFSLIFFQLENYLSWLFPSERHGKDKGRGKGTFQSSNGSIPYKNKAQLYISDCSCSAEEQGDFTPQNFEKQPFGTKPLLEELLFASSQEHSSRESLEPAGISQICTWIIELLLLLNGIIAAFATGDGSPALQTSL